MHTRTPFVVVVWLCVVACVSGAEWFGCDEIIADTCYVNNPQSYTEPQLVDLPYNIAVNAPITCINCPLTFVAPWIVVSSSITARALTFIVNTTILVEGYVQSGRDLMSMKANDLVILGSVRGSIMNFEIINALNITGGNITATGLGFGPDNGPGKGTAYGNQGGGGAGHGSPGSNSCYYTNFDNAGQPYDPDILPYQLGSGGGSILGILGGSGGGLINITAYTVNLTGRAKIEANGTPGGSSNSTASPHGAGGGSGGSINIICNSVRTAPESWGISANGGNGGRRFGTTPNSYDGGYGAGGRIWVNSTQPILENTLYLFVESGTTPCSPSSVPGSKRSSCPPGYNHPYGFIQPYTCEKCIAGFFSNRAGVDYCSPCETGYVSAVGATSCTKCLAGTYSYNASYCDNCTTGTYSQDAATSCYVCPAGFVSINGVCTPCPENTYEFNTICYVCPGAPPNSTRCTATGGCTPSTFYTGTECQKCPLGTYKTQQGQAECTNCSAGTFANTTGFKSACYQCPHNTYSTARASICQPCPEILYSNPGSEKCSECEERSKTNPNICETFKGSSRTPNSSKKRGGTAAVAIVVPVVIAGIVAIVVIAVLIMRKARANKQYKQQKVNSVEMHKPAKTMEAPPPYNPSSYPPPANPYAAASAPPMTGPTTSEPNICAVCYERPKEMIFLPCGHVATCSSCTNAITQSASPVCCICRSPIQSANRAFL